MSNSASLDALLRRLIDTPPDFLDPPRRGREGQLQVAAVVNDVLALHGVALPAALQASLSGNLAAVTANQLSLSAVMAWLLADEAWHALRFPREVLLPVFAEAVPALAAEAAVNRYLHEPDRREELVRTAIARLGLLPAGETAAQAADRLASVSSVERRRLLDASRAAEARARAIREALARKAAEESADKWTRE
ncbi:hypothetical protein [Stenotrophomonas sp.]|uniref:hypothetical protein n=1 Tax=Stenotrophomonas sp. TaxID=69392 RepID=UPI0028AE770D|nr:hypothetical protein [Stenotrophomonas sp.]